MSDNVYCTTKRVVSRLNVYSQQYELGPHTACIQG